MKKRLLFQLMYYLGVGSIYRQLSRIPYCIILVYHRVNHISDKGCFLREMIVEPAEFEWQMQYLIRHYEIIPLSLLKDFLVNKKKASFKMAVITFDDAYEDIYENAFPILKKYKLPATIFASTSFVETNRAFWWDRLEIILRKTKLKSLNFKFQGQDFMLKLKSGRFKQKAFNFISDLIKNANETSKNDLLTLLNSQLGVPIENSFPHVLSWSQMKEMLNYNISFGVHTNTHPVLSKLKQEELVEEIYKPKEIIESHLGNKVTSFAYPFGEIKDFNQNSINIIRNAGYEWALTMNQGFVYHGDSAFSLNRIGIGGNDTRESFKLKLSGLIPLFSKKK